jgi:hypothetical protein
MSVHNWRFFRSGGFDQVRIESGDDLANLHTLDQKLWAALSCPTQGLEFDRRTLELIDSDHDGRIRAPEILATVAWALRLIRDPEILAGGSDALPLSQIKLDNPEGAALHALASALLKNMGKADAAEITVADVVAATALFAMARFNGDGIITAETVAASDSRGVFDDVIVSMGGKTDQGGQPGIDDAALDAFFGELRALAAWHEKGKEDPKIQILGGATAEAADALNNVRAKIDDYFTRCGLAVYDPRAAAFLNTAEPAFAGLADKALSADGAETASFPLARIEPERPLPLGVGLNPAWSTRMAEFESLVARPLLNAPSVLHEKDWGELKSKFQAYNTWFAAKPAGHCDRLGMDRVQALLAGNGEAELRGLLVEDKALAQHVALTESLEKLVRLCRDLRTLLNNYISLRDFYLHDKTAIFQAGTLYLDGRSFDLCIRVDSVGKHASMAVLSQTYLLYCECSRKSTGEKMTIVAAVTAGDSDNLMIGRNGIFYDRDHRDWDATVVHIIENPISIKQAMFAPYKRASRLVNEQIQKLAASKEKNVGESTASGIAGAAKLDEKVPPQPFDVGKFAGIFAAIGLALGTIGAALASLITGMLTLAWWQLPLAFLGLGLAISGPSALIAWFKLRGRNLAPILDANGWAVNTKAKINIVFGGALTRLAELPEGAERALVDPFAEEETPWKRYLALLFLVLLLGGILYWRLVHS